MFVDDIEVSTGEGDTSFEGPDPMAAGRSPALRGSAGSRPNPNDFVRRAAGFPEGAAVATDDTLYMGFGFEGITDAATRNALMGRAIDYLLR